MTEQRQVAPRTLAVALGVAAVFAGCATAPYGVESAEKALADGRPEAALSTVDKRLATADPATQILLQLERAVLRLHTGDLTGAARDLAEADPALEVLDLDRDIDGKLAAALLSEAAGKYRPPAFEKLALNGLGMACRLAAGDLAGARVEARRFRLLERYYETTTTASAGAGGDAVPAGATALGRWLAAVVDEDASAGASGSAEATATTGELVVIVMAGRVPARGVSSLGRVDALQRTGQPVHPGDEKRTLRVLGLTAGRATEVALTLDDQPLAPALVADLAASARLAFTRVEPQLLRAAVARDTLRMASEQAGARGTGSGFLGSLVGATFASQDTPDTRAWRLLPERVVTARGAVAPGAHRLVVNGVARDVEVLAGARKVVLIALP